MNGHVSGCGDIQRDPDLPMQIVFKRLDHRESSESMRGRHCPRAFILDLPWAVDRSESAAKPCPYCVRAAGKGRFSTRLSPETVDKSARWLKRKRVRDRRLSGPQGACHALMIARTTASSTHRPAGTGQLFFFHPLGHVRPAGPCPVLFQERA